MRGRAKGNFVLFFARVVLGTGSNIRPESVALFDAETRVIGLIISSTSYTIGSMSKLLAIGEN